MKIRCMKDNVEIFKFKKKEEMSISSYINISIYAKF